MNHPELFEVARDYEFEFSKSHSARLTPGKDRNCSIQKPSFGRMAYESDPSRGLRQLALSPAGLRECFRLHPFYIDAFIGCGLLDPAITALSAGNPCILKLAESRFRTAGFSGDCEEFSAKSRGRTVSVVQALLQRVSQVTWAGQSNLAATKSPKL
jgi:hypothetical protein